MLAQPPAPDRRVDHLGEVDRAPAGITTVAGSALRTAGSSACSAQASETSRRAGVMPKLPARPQQPDASWVASRPIAFISATSGSLPRTAWWWQWVWTIAFGVPPSTVDRCGVKSGARSVSSSAKVRVCRHSRSTSGE